MIKKNLLYSYSWFIVLKHNINLYAFDIHKKGHYVRKCSKKSPLHFPVNPLGLLLLVTQCNIMQFSVKVM